MRQQAGTTRRPAQTRRRILAAIEESAYQVLLTSPALRTDGAAEAEGNSPNPGLSPADRLFLHTLASSGVEALRAALAEGLSHGEARQYMERIKAFLLHGWAGVLKTECAETSSPTRTGAARTEVALEEDP